MNRQVSDVQGQEEEALQFGQVVVSQLQIEYDGIATLQRLHGLIDVRHVRRLTKDVQAILLHLAHTRRDVGDRRTGLLTRLSRNHVEQSNENVDNSQDNGSSHFRSDSGTQCAAAPPPRTCWLAIPLLPCE